MRGFSKAPWVSYGKNVYSAPYEQYGGATMVAECYFDDDVAMIRLAPTMYDLLKRIRTDVTASLIAYEDQIRFSIGNTNYSILMRLMDEAQEIITDLGESA